MIIDYNGTVALWYKVYNEKQRSEDRIGKKIKKIPHIELNDGKLTFNKNSNLTVVRISEDTFYKFKHPNQYRRLVRIETTGNGKPRKELTSLLTEQGFSKY